MPYCPNDSLIEFILKANQANISISLPLTRYLARQVVEAVHELHKGQGKAHKDIKPDNILFTDKDSLKLIDFASLSPLQQYDYTVCGTFSYMPPDYHIARAYHSWRPY